VRYLADENVERQIVEALRRAGNEVEYIAETLPGANDPEVLERANRGSAVLVTADKDFGELAYRRRQQNAGVVLLRLSGLTQERKVAIALQVFADHSEEFADAFSVVTETGVRVRRPSGQEA
jgi:predicted nuclease of predicted toxin-antitoxin system